MKQATVFLYTAPWADGSTWGDVYHSSGEGCYRVIAVQKPAYSFADDVATTRRVIDAQDGSVSWSHSLRGA